MKKSKWVLKWIVAGAVIVAAIGAVTMLLWNWLMPTLFALPQLGFWQALGLLLLAKILFGGWGSRGCRGRGDHAWKHRYFEKLSTMSPEERERFKARMREKWCAPPPAAGVNRPGDTSID